MDRNEMKVFVLLILTSLFLSGCIAGKGDIKIDVKRRPKAISSSAIASVSVSTVQIINHQLVISGTGLSDVANVRIDGNSLNENFLIESKTATQIVANSLNVFSFDVSKVFNLILSDANASATFPIDFSLCNATLNGKGFDCGIAASDKDVLSYDQATNKWRPRSINGLSYQGSWDANDPLPSTNSPGDYFIVSNANTPYGVGDWIVWNGGNYDQINNSNTITSVFGRTGAVVATEGDYDLDKLFDVDLSIAPTNGKVLKFNGTKWVAADDLSGGGAGSVTAAEIADGAVTDVKIDSVSAGKITGTLTSAQIADGTIVNADINAAAAIDYSKLNIPNTTIPYAKLNIVDGDIPASKISGLPAATSVLAATIVDADTTHAPDGNAVFDALGLKLNTTGGTLTIGTISGVPTPTNSDDVANKGYTDTRDALKLAKAGDTMSGVLTLDSDLKIKGGSNYVTVKGHATSAAYDLVLPINKGTSGYVLATDGNGNTAWIDVTTAVTTLDTDDVAEGSRLYFTEPRVLGTDLAGLNTGAVGPIVAADTLLGAMGKLQYQVTDLKGKGQWEKSGSDVYYSAGDVQIDKKLKLQDSGTNYVQIKAPTTVGATYTLTMPINDGDANQVLKTDGAGVLAWVDVTDASVQTFAKAALPTCAAGEVLKSNGTSFSCITDNAGAGAFNGTANKAVVTGAGGALEASTTSSTELGYVAGVTSAIQTQLNNKEAVFAGGTVAQYLNGNKVFVTLDTSVVPENGNLYFTDARARSVPLTGFVANNSAIAATDSVLAGLEKSQGQITNLNSIKANVAGDTFTGDVTFNTQVRLKDGAAGAYVTLKAPATGTTSHTLTLPGTVGTSGQVLSMTGTAGVLAWTTPSSSAAPSGAAGGDLSGTYPNPTIANLDAAKLATGVVDNTELNYLDGVTSSIQTQLTGKQASDATLTALAAFNANGIMVQTAADTFVGRSIAGTANRVTVANGDGIAGNPTVNIFTALLPSPVVGDVGKFLKSTAADTSVWTALGSSDITTALGFTPVNKAGDSITTGTITLSGAAVLRSPDPIGLTDVANKQYVDSYGQWTKTGSNIYYSIGNVGIGTTNPIQKLDVSGIIRAGSSTATAGSTILTDAYSSGNLTTFGTEYSSGGPVLGYGITPSTTATASFVSSTPSALTRSSLVMSDSFRFYTGTSQTVATGSDVTMSEVMRITNIGNVGIGTNAPAQKLSVVGNITVTGEVTSKDFFQKTVSIADGWAVGDYVEIVQASPGAAGASTHWEVHLSGTRNSWTEGTTYLISGTHSGGTSWREAPQSSESGYIGASKCFTVDINSNVSAPQFRIRALKASASCGTPAALPLNFRIRAIGLNSSWTSLSATGSGATVVGTQSMGLSWNVYTGNPQANGVPALHANSLGNVGIGTTTPNTKLEVAGTILTTGTAYVGLNSTNGSFADNTSRAYMSSNGYIWSTMAAGESSSNLYLHRNNTSYYFIQFGYGASTVGSVSTNGTSVAYNTTSDYRLKDNITPMTNSVQRLLAIQPKRFNYKSKPEERVDGFIAHEISEVVPEAVQGKKDAVNDKGEMIPQLVDYSKIVPVLAGAIKESFLKWQGDSKEIHREIASLKKNNELLKKDNELLKRKNNETEIRLKKLEQAILKKK